MLKAIVGIMALPNSNLVIPSYATLASEAAIASLCAARVKIGSTVRQLYLDQETQGQILRLHPRFLVLPYYQCGRNGERKESLISVLWMTRTRNWTRTLSLLINTPCLALRDLREKEIFSCLLAD
jgi:hypothetical protein